uniref:Uncharacterized protein n=1 Tax=Oryza meridionalis TaxID=40149 RepID=A0A0E0EJ23_9ORYZ
MLFSCELSYSRKQPGFSTTDRSMSSEIKQPSRSKASWLASSLSSPEIEVTPIRLTVMENPSTCHPRVHLADRPELVPAAAPSLGAEEADTAATAA